MLIKHAIFVGSMTALASLTAPALAKHSDAQKTSEQATSSPCSARQRMADGTWNMEHGRSFRVGNWVPKNKHRANPRREVRTDKRAENRWPAPRRTPARVVRHFRSTEV